VGSLAVQNEADKPSSDMQSQAVAYAFAVVTAVVMNVSSDVWFIAAARAHGDAAVSAINAC
jgi:hypothetical protein